MQKLGDPVSIYRKMAINPRLTTLIGSRKFCSVKRWKVKPSVKHQLGQDINMLRNMRKSIEKDEVWGSRKVDQGSTGFALALEMVSPSLDGNWTSASSFQSQLGIIHWIWSCPGRGILRRAQRVLFLQWHS